MEQERVVWYLRHLRQEIAPAMGCTEPAAVALAAAHAAKALGEEPKRVELAVSEYILKNGMNVGIPGTKLSGLDIAAALGAICAAPEKGLMVLSGLAQEQREAAMAMAAEKRVCITLAATSQRIYIDAVMTGERGSARAVISGFHTALVLLEKDGEPLYTACGEASLSPAAEQPLESTGTIEEILEFIDTVGVDELSFLQELLTMNLSIAQEGMARPYGLCVGKIIAGGGSLISNDVCNFAVALTAAAADARMAGCDKPVMSVAGSGNQGLTASLPVAAVGIRLGKPEESVLRALALSVLVTVHTKRHIGKLSVLCGCSIAAAIGACCGILFLQGGTLAQMGAGISSMVADISGVVCDGAKPGCALKIATAVNSAFRAANMALLGIGAGSHDGIVTGNVEETLANLGRLGNEGMEAANGVILNMMLDK